MMLQIEDLKQELQAQQPKIEYLKEALGYENLLKEKESWTNKLQNLIFGMMSKIQNRY